MLFALRFDAYAVERKVTLEGPRADALREASLILLAKDPRRTLYVLNSMDVRVTKSDGAVDVLFQPRAAYRAHPIVRPFSIRLRRRITLSTTDDNAPNFPIVIDMPGRYAAALISVLEYRRRSRIDRSANGVRLTSPATSVSFETRRDGTMALALAEVPASGSTPIGCFKAESYLVEPQSFVVLPLPTCPDHRGDS